MSLRHLLAVVTTLLLSVFTSAQDAVTLHSVTLDASNNVTVVYSKNFATCAHMRFSNATCTQNGPLTHVNNLFCTQGNQVSITVPSTSFVAGFAPGISVYMVHGNNGGVASPCVLVGCNGVYGTGCAGTSGVPALAANNDCPAAGSALDLNISNAAPGTLAVLGFGIGQGSIPVLGCNLLLGSLDTTATVAFSGTGDGAFSFVLPIGSSGATFTTQAFALDVGGPEGFSATNGLLIRVQ